jgi:succinate dehydrogenase / fumarate reductase cytochrome b subunit
MSMSGSHASFLLRRAHSLAGVVPLGMFLIEHMLTNATALWGRASFDRAVDRIHRLAGLVWLEAVGIALPLCFHAVYGIAIARNTQPNVGRYPYGANWLFVLQRITGVLTFVFVLVHLWHFRIAKARGTLDISQFYLEIDRMFAKPAMFALYFAGLTATVFHFANGLRTACETWGISSTERARKTVAIAALIVGLSLWGIGVDTMYHFTLRCGGVIPLPTLDRLAVCGV